MILAAGYVRVSSEEQAREGFSLEAQDNHIRKYVNDEGWQLHDMYVDPGKSGKDLKRPDMQRLIADLQAGKFQVIIVHKLDRLTRNVGDLHYLLQLLEKHNIKLVSISEKLDTSTAMGRMFVYMLGIFAQWYRENLSEEVIKGQEQRAKNGLRNTASRPYGYEVGENLALSVNPVEAEHVRQIFEWYLAGHGIIKIATLLNKNGVPSPGGSIWRDRNIGDILDNITYVGAVHWKRETDPEEKRIIVHDVHEPIISKETFELAQDLRTKKAEHHMNMSSYDFPYSTIVKCGECGRSYHGKIKSRMKAHHKRTRFYRCSGRYRQDPCYAPDINEEVLTPLFLQFISNFHIQADDPEKTISNTKDAAKEKKRLEKLIAGSAQVKKNYSRAMGSGRMSYEEFCELVDEENKKLEQWQSELSQLEEVQPERKRTRKDILAVLQNLKEEWPHMTYEQQKQNIQRLFQFLVIKKYDRTDWRIVAYKVYE
jgi:site-specific DNA recombinase